MNDDEYLERTSISVELPLLTWYRIIAAARHGEQEILRALREGRHPEHEESLGKVRNVWLESIADLADQLQEDPGRGASDESTGKFEP
jgi:hypothetical protein